MHFLKKFFFVCFLLVTSSINPYCHSTAMLEMDMFEVLLLI